MREIRYVGRFKRDYKREKSGRHGKDLDDLLSSIVELLAADMLLSPLNRDHTLSGDWSDHRDCHIKPDLVLIYRKVQYDFIDLVRLGSHSKLGI